MLRLEEALRRVADALPRGGRRVERVPLAAAVGRVLAADVRMDHDVPPFRRATMDGYAFVAAPEPGVPVPVTLRVSAGDAPGARLAAGEASLVMTGAPMPEGATCVVPFEWTDEGREAVTLARAAGDDAFVVEAGAHAAAGTVILSAGTRLPAAAPGALATAGVAEVSVFARPRVAVLGTGDELVPVATVPGPGRIRNSNGPLLTALATAAGAEARDHGIASDEEGPLRAALASALDGADIVLTSGGVSRGDRDLVPGLLAELGVRELFHRWAVQPGGPLWCGVRGETLVVGLPGNPAASRVGFELLVRPALDALAGQAFVPRAGVKAFWQGAWGRAMPRRRFRPVDVHVDADGTLIATSRPWRGSGDPFALSDAPAWLVLPEDTPAPEAGPRGTLVDVLLLDVPLSMRSAP
ncbi:MAG: molybdopterin molybdotransferase MoeA [Planctomycetes bacterium]|nr:molybdopterin molybdotransferase MoeA [Planctomycetota bacterium]